MATSGSANYLVNRNEIIAEALELIGELPAGDTVGANDVSSCARTLNMMIKHWQARGVALWKNTQVVVFLSPGGQYYQLGPSGDRAAYLSDMVETTVATAAVAGASTITVDDATGMASGDSIGVELSDGTLQWTTINGAPAADVVTLAAVLAGEVAADAHVYTYTTTIGRPLFITEARHHYASGQEVTLRPVSRNQYMRLATKTTTGSTSQYYYDPQTTNGRLYVWPTASTVQDYLVLTARMPIEDFDGATDDQDFPQEWMLPLAYNLAVLIAPKYDQEMSADFKGLAARFLLDAEDSAVDHGSVFFETEGD